jgi:hypothetical protein
MHGTRHYPSDVVSIVVLHTQASNRDVLVDFDLLKHSVTTQQRRASSLAQAHEAGRSQICDAHAGNTPPMSMVPNDIFPRACVRVKGFLTAPRARVSMMEG